MIVVQGANEDSSIFDKKLVLIFFLLNYLYLDLQLRRMYGITYICLVTIKSSICFHKPLTIIPFIPTSDYLFSGDVKISQLFTILDLALYVGWNMVILLHINFMYKVYKNGGYKYFIDIVKPYHIILYLISMQLMLYLSGLSFLVPIGNMSQIFGFIWFHGMVVSLYSLEWKKKHFYDENTENHLDRTYELVRYN